MSGVLYASRALLPEGWADNVVLRIGRDGRIEEVTSKERPPGHAERIDGTLLPGIANCHSHAFQRLMAGRCEYFSGSGDDFWGWRDAMYRVVASLQPEVLQATAALLYVEMLKAGYTGVAEFHYVHHQPDGTPYSEPAEMAMRVLGAAHEAGIRCCLLPTLYRHGDFGGQPHTAGQRRFINTVDSFGAIMATMQRLAGAQRRCHLGMAFHSLRAVDETDLRQSLEMFSALQCAGPIHIHIGEQQREVDACLAWSGQRPVEWLLSHLEVDARWTLVHATHLNAAEVRELAGSGAVAGLCPTTEANLGDGLFMAVPYLGKSGVIAIGSDSQVSVDPAAELRLLEYGQRLVLRRRGVLADAAIPAVGEFLYRHVAAGGARSLGVAGGTIAVGQYADFIVLDDDDPVLAGRRDADLLNAWVFASQRPAVRDVMVDGQWKVRNGRHMDEERILAQYRGVVAGME